MTRGALYVELAAYERSSVQSGRTGASARGRPWWSPASTGCSPAGGRPAGPSPPPRRWRPSSSVSSSGPSRASRCGAGGPCCWPRSAFAAVFELARSGAVGPTVDRISLGSPYGVLAFAVGRGVHGLLAMVPMLLGATLGAAWPDASTASGRGRHGWARVGLWARRAGHRARHRGAAGPDPRRPPAGAHRPHPRRRRRAPRRERRRADPGRRRRPRPGHDDPRRQHDNPVLLFLAGGPGGTELGAMRRHGRALEQDFVVATFDQRGTGKSYDALDPTSTLTLDRAVSDTIEVTNYLRDRFGQDKIYLVGHSWGTILGRARRAAASRAVPRLHRHRADGQPARDRPRLLR